MKSVVVSVAMLALALGVADAATKTVTTPPPSTDPSLTFLTLGDFGATLTFQGAPDVTSDGTKKNPMCASAKQGWGSRVNEKVPYVTCGSAEWWKQWHAQQALAMLMGDSASRISPKAVITQGDNFYWDGVANANSALFQAVFEDIYSAPSLLNIPWLMCLGNHDVGGTAYICGTDTGTLEGNDVWHKKCSSGSEASAAIMAYYNAQKNYKSKNNNRWVFEGFYYKKSFTQNDVSVEIFTIDTNVATTHGINEICCQCYGYGKEIVDNCAKGTDAATCGKCKNAVPGDPYCAPTDIYKGCYDTIYDWFDKSMTNLEADLAKSTATWKVVNTHYCPIRHFATADKTYQRIISATKGKVNLFLCGHTHAPSHDYQNATKINYVMDGSGGGITAEAAGMPDASMGSTNMWTLGNIYAFTELYFDENWAKVRFITPDDSWGWSETISKGGAKEAYCSYVPVDGSKPIKCSDAKSWKAPTSSSSPTSSGNGDSSSGDSSNSDGGSNTNNNSDGSSSSKSAAISTLPSLSLAVLTAAGAFFATLL